MSTFFLQRGIRLPIGRPIHIDVAELAAGSNGADTGHGTQISHTNPLENRIERFLAERGHTVILRLADVDPLCQAQRAEVSLVRNDENTVRRAVALLKERTGVPDIVIACHKGQDIGVWGQHAAQVLRVHHAHYPMMSTPCLAKRLIKGQPVLTEDLQIKGVLVADPGELLDMVMPGRKFVVSFIQPREIKNVFVRRGTTVARLLDALNVLVSDQRLVMGTPLTGDACIQLNAVIETDSISICGATETLNLNRPCCNCGKCVKVCPSGLQPGLLSKHIFISNFDVAKALNVQSCIECGCCSYVCPSRRPLVEYMRWGKKGGAAT